MSHPSSIPPAPNDFTVTVFHNTNPVEDALVCVSMDTSVYEYGYTDFEGEVTFSIAPSGAGTLWVTVTAHNYLPYEGECLVGTGVEELTSYKLPVTSYRLLQNYPNPFTAVTSVQFSVRPDASGPRAVPSGVGDQHLSLRVHDVSGRLIRTLFDETLTTDHLPLTTAVLWDGRDDEGNPMPGGVYFLRMSIGDYGENRKMVLVK